MSAGKRRGRWIEPSRRRRDSTDDFFPAFADADERLREMERRAARALAEGRLMAVVAWSPTTGDRNATDEHTGDAR